MNRKRAFLVLIFFSLAPLNSVAAQDRDILVPAGTLLRCTLSEPNFTPATTEIGDPVVCSVDAIQEFGRTIPRGTYLVGRLLDAHKPGHFFGKGSMTLSFDRIGLPETELTFPGKIIVASKNRVNREGTIVGRGHAKRDAVEWMIPIMWPWKVLTLPMRGPEPALKGEVRVTVRVMEDLLLPSQTSAAQALPNPSSRPLTSSPPSSHASSYYASYASARPVARDSELRVPAELRVPSPNLTLLALKPDSVYVVSDYWLADDLRLTFVLSTGAQRTVDLSELDWDMTTRLNADRGVRVVLRDDGPHAF